MLGAGSTRGSRRDVGRDVAGRRCAEDERGARLRVPRLVAGAVEGADGDGVARVGVAVVVARVHARTAVAAGPDVDGAEAAAAVGDALVEGALGHGARALEAHSVVVGAPAVAEDGVARELVRERLGLLRVGDVLGEDAQTRDLGAGRDTGRADAVVDGTGGDAGGRRAVKVPRHGLDRVVERLVKVLGAHRAEAALELGVVADAVVDDGDRRADARDAHLPRGLDVDVDARAAVQVPRAAVQRVVGRQRDGAHVALARHLALDLENRVTELERERQTRPRKVEHHRVAEERRDAPEARDARQLVDVDVRREAHHPVVGQPAVRRRRRRWVGTRQIGTIDREHCFTHAHKSRSVCSRD